MADFIRKVGRNPVVKRWFRGVNWKELGTITKLPTSIEHFFEYRRACGKV